MLAGCQQRFGNLAVQMVGNHDADGIDVISIDDRLPAALRPFEAVAIFSVAHEVCIDIGNCNQADRWRFHTENRLGVAVGMRV
jgi:hypothetical protein